jgi:DNA modification methylase
MENRINVQDEKWDLDLDYTGENNFASFASNGNIHSYPAKLVPDMVNSLLIKLRNEYKINKVLDPFVGSGTVALESKYLGLDFYGSDLNPLAVLLARTKSLTIENINYFTKVLRGFIEELSQSNIKSTSIYEIVNFKNINYWFKEKNINELSYIKFMIINFLKSRNKKYIEQYSLVLLTAFSSTIRTCSLTRNAEFKLYRMSPSEIVNFNINSIDTFVKHLNKLVEMLQTVNKVYKKNSITKINLDNAKELKYLGNTKVDLILTSPPYGDSKSTVAYGQFSRLSLQWISDLLENYLNIKVYAENCDEYLLGGGKSEYQLFSNQFINDSKALQELLIKMDSVIEKELFELNTLKSETYWLLDTIKKSGNITNNQINIELWKLIRERIRLDFYRETNKNDKLSRKEVKKISNHKTEMFIEEIFNSTIDTNTKDELLIELADKLHYVIQTINRKIKSLPKRKNEVINFFKDLYKVVNKTDSLLNSNGLQVWIVGHRTVLGHVSVNMRDILNDWFKSMDYLEITSIKRQYSFKRLPHHINSTASRNDEIQTMMYEHILIVQKL